MPKIVKIAVLASALVLAGCATTEGFKKIVQSWVGSSESQLIANWGVPIRTHESSGTRYLEYDYQHQGYYTTCNSGYCATNTIHKRCITTFAVRNGVIVNWSFRGNDCKAHEK